LTLAEDFPGVVVLDRIANFRFFLQIGGRDVGQLQLVVDSQGGVVQSLYDRGVSVFKLGVLADESNLNFLKLYAKQKN
jgi:hypothetical protein